MLLNDGYDYQFGSGGGGSSYISTTNNTSFDRPSSDLPFSSDYICYGDKRNISNISKGGIGSNDLTDRNSYGGDGLVTIDYLDDNETTIYKEYYTYKENNEIYTKYIKYNDVKKIKVKIWAAGGGGAILSNESEFAEYKPQDGGDGGYVYSEFDFNSESDDIKKYLDNQESIWENCGTTAPTEENVILMTGSENGAADSSTNYIPLYGVWKR